MEAVAHFKEGQEHYRARRWDKARRAFDNAAVLNPEDHLPLLYIERCAHFSAQPPPADWAGEWIMATK
jgi:adenylate cyclase